MKWRFLLGVFLALSLAAPAFGENTELVQDVRTYEPVPAEAGGYVDVFVQVENEGDDAADSAVCELEPSFPFTLQDNQETTYLSSKDPGKRVLGKIKPGQAHTLQYRLKVDSNSVEGFNEFETRCRADDNSAWIYEDHSIRVQEGVKFSVNEVSIPGDSLEPDSDNVEVDVSVANIGGSDADLVHSTLKLPEGFTASESYENRDSIGEIDAGDTGTASFDLDVEGISPGEYEAGLELSYDSDSGSSVETLDVPLDVQPRPQFEFGDSIEVQSGSSRQVSVPVSNTGQAEGESASVYMQESSDHPFEFTDNYAYLRDLKGNETATGRFTVKTDAESSGSYTTDVEFRYTEDGDVKTREGSIEVEVSSQNSVNNSLMVLAGGAALIILLTVLGLRSGLLDIKKLVKND